MLNKIVLIRTLLVLTIASSVVSQSETMLNHTAAWDSNQNYYYKVAAENATGVKVHFILDFLKTNNEELDHVLQNNTSTHFEYNLESMLTETLNGDWNNTKLLLELADLSKDVNVKTTVFSILLHALQTTKKIYNPFQLITLYQQFEIILANTTNLSSVQISKIDSIRLQLRNAITWRSAQILEAEIHIPNNLRNLLPQYLLIQLNLLEDSIFVETLEKMYDAVEDLVTLDQLAYIVVSNFTINTKQKIIASLQLLDRLRNGSATKVRQLLVDNLKSSVNNQDFGKLSPKWRARVNQFLPISMRNLYGATMVCIRNATNAAQYLYECPQTYLVCTNGKQLQQATFLVDHNSVDGRQFAFRSLYWTNRYIRLENSTAVNMTVTGAYVKNVYSKLGAAYWHVVYIGDNVALADPTLSFYLCGGNSVAWSGEQHVYTRRVTDFSRYQQECQWFIEDCGKI